MAKQHGARRCLTCLARVPCSLTSTAVSQYASTTVTAPEPTASGTTSQFGEWYQVRLGDYCQLIALNVTIDLSLLEAINPSIDAGCDNLVPGLYYCVMPTALWNNTSNGTTTMSSYLLPPAATPSGTTPDCYAWWTVSSGNTCYLIEQSYGIKIEQLQTWNPSLNGDCSNLLGEAYCVDSPDTTPYSSASTPTVALTSTGPVSTSTTSTPSTTSSFSTPPTATPSGTTAECYEWYIIQSGDYCVLVKSKFGISFAQLQAWNPSLDSSCDNLLLREAYCVSSPVAIS